MNYGYTDETGMAYFACDCGVTYPEGSFENGDCPECK